jgi:hypothetical protein
MALFIWLPEGTAPGAAATSTAAENAGETPATSAPAQAVTDPAAAGSSTAEQAAQTQAAADEAPPPDLAAGEAALRANQPALARAAFQRVLLRDPDDEKARAGIAASDALQSALDAYSRAMRTETAGDLEQAQSQYQDILQHKPDFAAARAALTRVQELRRAQALEAALSQGAQALAAGRIEAAGQAYARAAALRPDEPRVRDGQARIAEIRRSERNRSDLATGTDLERQERWDEAVAHYREVLARDAQLHFADDGLARSTRRAELDRELRDYLERPERLTAAAVRQAAGRALARGEATSPQGAKLAAQLAQLRARMAVLDAPARVQILSDNSTQISLASVGELGIFTQRELNLPPGQYTVIGRREGFRDVRQELNIAPGEQHVALTVRCTERI